MAWLEKRRCVIKLGRKASCSLTTLGMLMESSSKKEEEEKVHNQIQKTAHKFNFLEKEQVN